MKKLTNKKYLIFSLLLFLGAGTYCDIINNFFNILLASPESLNEEFLFSLIKDRHSIYYKTLFISCNVFSIVSFFKFLKLNPEFKNHLLSLFVPNKNITIEEYQNNFISPKETTQIALHQEFMVLVDEYSKIKHLLPKTEQKIFDNLILNDLNNSIISFLELKTSHIINENLKNIENEIQNRIKEVLGLLNVKLNSNLENVENKLKTIKYYIKEKQNEI